MHFGKNRNNPFLLKETSDFLKNQFFPTVKEYGVETIINVGDIFDARINIGVPAIDCFRESYEREFQKLVDVEHHHILGNHDVLYGHTNSVNSPNLIFQDKTFIWSGPVELEFDNTKVLFVPWINKENYDETMRMIGKTTAKILIGHLEIAGFDHGGTKSHGLSQSLFSKFDLVLSGHFHKQQKIGNIYYLGNTLVHDWGEYGNSVGFHIWDTETGELEFIENHDYNHFKKIIYQDGMKAPSKLEGKNVKIIHGIKESESDFERFVTAIESQKPYQVHFVDQSKVTLSEMVTESIEQEIEAKDIPEIMVEYIDKIDVDTVSEEYKEGVKKFLIDVYKEARAS